MQWGLAYLAIGLAVGFFAGLLGIGGGAVMVPLLVLVFTAQGLPADHVMHMALATSMAAIVFTSVSSMLAHHAHGAVDWAIARAMAPGILAGAFCAALVAGLIAKRPLAVMFTALVFYAATQILLDLRPKRSRELPGTLGLSAAAAVIGAVASLLAAGGAFLCIPFLAWCRVPLRRAIGTAAAGPARRGLAGPQPRLCLHPGARSRGRDEHARRAARRPPRASPAGEAPSDHLRAPSLCPRPAHAGQPLVKR